MRGRRSRLIESAVAFWRMEEASGTRTDATGRGNDLTDNNTVAQAAGRVGNAGQFVAANSEYLSRADNADLSTGDIDFSVAAWVYLDTKPASFSRGVLTKGGIDGDQPNDEYGLYYNLTLDLFRFLIANGTTFNAVSASSMGSPSTGQWYFLVAWHDSIANTINIQVDDGVVDSVATTIQPQDGAGAFNVGYWGSGAEAGRYMDGRIDAVGKWNRVLSAAERTELYNAGNGKEWPF